MCRRRISTSARCVAEEPGHVTGAADREGRDGSGGGDADASGPGAGRQGRLRRVGRRRPQPRAPPSPPSPALEDAGLTELVCVMTPAHDECPAHFARAPIARLISCTAGRYPIAVDNARTGKVVATHAPGNKVFSAGEPKVSVDPPWCEGIASEVPDLTQSMLATADTHEPGKPDWPVATQGIFHGPRLTWNMGSFAATCSIAASTILIIMFRLERRLGSLALTSQKAKYSCDDSTTFGRLCDVPVPVVPRELGCG